nr:uncharacterized protein LOC117684485 [Crassostrea gigas]
MKASRNRSISAGILIAFCFAGIFVSGGFVSRGWNQTPLRKDDKSKNRFEDDRSSSELVIDATLRELSRHWLECYFNKTAKYDSVHVQARRLFSFETYDVSESDRKLLEETTQEYLKTKRTLTGHRADGNEKQEENSEFDVRENQSGENGKRTSQNLENESKTEKEQQPNSNRRFQKMRKRMRRDVTESVLVREGIMKITDGVEWSDDFLNKTSEAYQQLEEMVLTVIDTLFQNSPIASYFYGSFINDFRKGSVIVLFTIEFKNDTNTTHTDESINEAFHEALLNASAFTNLTLDLNSSKIVTNAVKVASDDE